MSDGIKAIIGKTIEKVIEESGSVVFVCTDGNAFEAYHMQDCCEFVRIYDTTGDLQSLVGQVIIDAHENESREWPADVPEDSYVDSFTWTEHVFKTSNHTITVRWLGESNGYYSESVYFGRTHKPICDLRKKIDESGIQL